VAVSVHMGKLGSFGSTAFDAEALVASVISSYIDHMPPMLFCAL